MMTERRTFDYGKIGKDFLDRQRPLYQQLLFEMEPRKHTREDILHELKQGLVTDKFSSKYNFEE